MPIAAALRVRVRVSDHAAVVSDFSHSIWN
jgi:hypothetical protein